MKAARRLRRHAARVAAASSPARRAFATRAITSGWSYDITEQTLEFNASAAPEVGAEVVVSYTLLPDCPG